MRVRAFFATTLIWVTVITNCQIDKLHFDRFTTSTGLSNNRVYDILQDKQGFIWFGTLDGLNRYDGYNINIYRNIPLDSLSLQNNRITGMTEDSNGSIWLITKKNGINRFNIRTESFFHYREIDGYDKDLYDLEINSIIETDHKEILLYSAKRLFKYLPNEDIITFVSEHDSNTFKPTDEIIDIRKRIKEKYSMDVEITSIAKEERFNWVATRREGLFIEHISDDSKTIEHYQHEPFDHAEIKCVFKDRSGIIWIGTKNKGVFKHNPLTRNFKLYNTFSNNKEDIEGTTIRAITEDNDGNIWLGTYNNGLIKLNREQKKITRYKNEAGNKKSLPNNMVRSLFTDINGHIWVGTYKGASKYNISEDCFENYLPINEEEIPAEITDSFHIYFHRVYGFDNDYFGNLWIANWKGLSRFNTKTQTFKHYPHTFFEIDNIREVYVDKNNVIWIGAEFGGVVQFNALTEEFVHYKPDNKEQSLSHQNVFAIHEGNDNMFYISTFNGLTVFNKKTGIFNSYTDTDGLSGNMVYGILEDKTGRIWLTTTNGLSVFNPQNKKFTNYSKQIGLQDNEFTEGAYSNTKSGEMIIGGINGINIFHPEMIKKDTIAPQIVITSLQLFNQPVKVGSHGKILDRSINYTSEVTLKHKNKMISFEFAALHFAIPQENKYKYMLEGFDEDWLQTNAQRRFTTYTNLKPGKYVFKVLASNSDDFWSTKPAELNLIILSPWWRTWWAFLIYSLLLITLLLLFRYYSFRSIQMKNELQLERVKREKSDEMSQMKLNFFTNISHEYRTPLSLILGPLEDILEQDLNSPLKESLPKLEQIQVNSHKMLSLTNQIMDLRKIEMGKMTLYVNKTSLSSFISQIVAHFKEVADHKNISLEYINNIGNTDVWIDQEKFEKIINNLLSNALKFTHAETGKIEVILSLEDDFQNTDALIIGKLPRERFCMITVKDNGIGIPKEQLEKIFQQFYRIDSSVSLSVKGSGVGLALVKEMVELHHGTITVESSEQSGSVFRVLLSLGNKHFTTSELENQQEALPLKTGKHATLLKEILPNQTEENNSPEKKTILIVEDNVELLNYTASILKNEYNILQATDGQSGIEIAFKKLPDLIISDIIMPHKTGLELCQVLKNDIKTSHILILLLTARTSDEDRMEGFLNKADDYITKPFNKKLLKVRVSNLIDSRELLIKNLGDIKNHKQIIKKGLTPIDAEFLERLNSIVEANISNVSFSIEILSNELGMSRSNLHIKLKALTKQSATEYIRTFRLNQALILLQEQRKNINEISYEVGFNSPSYFIKCFKEKFGITPKEYGQI
jgi:signal transduction histidine kinase/ligand-binding sensor domain-containing protein/DNA-binding response OmpR family regulator